MTVLRIRSENWPAANLNLHDDSTRSLQKSKEIQ